MASTAASSPSPSRNFSATARFLRRPSPGLTAVAISPGFWAFLFSPVLDVRFSRRFYAVALAAFASLTLVVAFLSLGHLALLEVVLTAGFFAAYLYQSALGGWLSSITSAEEENLVSVWMTIGNIGGFGLMAIGCNQIVRHLSPLAAGAGPGRIHPRADHSVSLHAGARP